MEAHGSVGVGVMQQATGLIPVGWRAVRRGGTISLKKQDGCIKVASQP